MATVSGKKTCLRNEQDYAAAFGKISEFHRYDPCPEEAAEDPVKEEAAEVAESHDAESPNPDAVAEAPAAPRRGPGRPPKAKG